MGSQLTGIWRNLCGAAAIGLTAIAPTPTLANPQDSSEVADVFDRDCGDDRGQDRCDQEMQRTMRALYQWDAAQELVDANVQFRRFMMVDGYGRDVLGLVFERRPASSPRVIVSVPKYELREGQKPLPPDAPLSAILSGAQWDRALAVTENFDQQLAREGQENDGGDTIKICLHAWFTVMEAGDPASRKDDKFRSDAEDACLDGLAMWSSFELAELAFEALPECHGLELDNFRNRISLLAYCKRLGGDRMAAAQAHEFVKRLESLDEVDGRMPLAEFFSHDNQTAAAELARRLEGETINWAAPLGEGPQGVSLTGSVFSEVSETENSVTYRYADITLMLENGGSRWRIASYEMSDFRILTETFDD